MTTRFVVGGGGAALALGSLLVGAGEVWGQVGYVGANFAGSNRNQSGFIPPDTMGAIGPGHFVEMINGRYAVYSRTGALVSSSSLDGFWASAGVTPTSYSFDPRISYDPNSGRWFAVAADNPGASNSVLVAVSNSSDPTAGWKAMKFAADPTGTHWIDFPTLGYDRDALVIGGDLFPVGSTGSFYTSLTVVPKGDLLQASPTVARRTEFAGTAGYSGQQPVVDRDGNLPAVVLSADFSSPGNLYRTTIGGTATAPTLTGGVSITAPAFGSPPEVNQPGSKPNLDGGEGWLASAAVMAGGSLWAVQGVDSGGRAAARWLRINPATNTVVESGVISSSTLAYSFPSIAANGQGGVVIGFTGTSATTTYPSTYAVVGRTTAGGVTTFGTPFRTQAGASDYSGLDGTVNRWGDYSSTTLDPTDPDVYWTIQEYVSATDVWSTRVTEIIAPAPGQVRWKNGTNGAYATAANWLAGAAPTSSSDVVLSNYGATYTVTVSGSTTASSLTARRGTVTLSLGAGNTLNLTRTSGGPGLAVADFYGTGSLTLPGGTVTAGSAAVGYASGGTGTLNISGAAVTLSGTLTVANAAGTVNLSGGSLSAAGVSLAGTLNQTGGVLSAGAVSIPGGRLNVAAGGTRTLRATSLSVTAGGRLDLNDNDGVINYAGGSPVTSVRSYLLAGYNGGSWDGAGGVDSTSAKNAAGRHTGLGYGEASAVLGLSGGGTATWSGVLVDATSLLIKYTWYGDVNLDGRVGADDYAVMDRGFAKHLAGGSARWTDGDFNYDGSVTSADYLLMDAAYGAQTGVLSPELLAEREGEFGRAYVAALVAAVPEPGSVVVVVACAVMGPVGRGRRRGA